MRDDLAKRNNEINFVYVPKKKKDKTPTKPFHFVNNVKLMPLVVQVDKQNTGKMRQNEEFFIKGRKSFVPTPDITHTTP